MQRRARRRGIRASLVVALGLMMFVPVMMIVPQEVAATTYYETYFPSAYNSTYWKVYPRYPSTPVACYPLQVYGDYSIEDLYTTADITYIETNDFTNPTWYLPSSTREREVVSEMPPDNGTATIDYVYLVFWTWLTGIGPDFYYCFSTDGKATWHWSPLLAWSSATSIYNVTSVITWTPAILNSDDLWVRAKILWDSPLHMQTLYLGLIVGWTAPWGAEDPPAEEDPSTSDRFWTYDLTGGGVVGMMGIVGLGGLIATPAWAVLSYRNSEDGRIVTFIKALAMGTFCLTLFLASFLA